MIGTWVCEILFIQLIDQNIKILGLYGACSAGNLEISKLMISKGADDWNGGIKIK